MRRDDENDTVLYEVDLEADAALEAPFDTWLRDHIADVLQFEGFLSAEILGDAATPQGRIRRIVQYRLRNQAALDRYLREQQPRMIAQGVERFGDRYSRRERQLAHREEFIRGAVSTENCLDCGEVLTGQHCSFCGQRARVRVLSLGTLLRDLLGDLLDWDARLWRTLRPLAFKPGALTTEFLRGRRTYYSPPFRMYLILSVMFFLAASLGPNPPVLEFDVSGDGANLKLSDGQDAAPPATASKLDPQRQRIVDAIVAHVPDIDRAKARADLEHDMADMKPDQVQAAQRFVDDPCGQEQLQVDIGPIGEKYEPRLREACRKIVSDSKGYGRALYENVPKMMFIFLPLIAAVMFVLYLGSGRYYVEHLLFFVHFHAFFFLGGLVAVVFARLAATFGDGTIGNLAKAAEGLTTVILVIYVPYYLYRAMRRVYGQGRIVTLLKFSMLGVGYLVFMTLTAVGLLFYTAITL